MKRTFEHSILLCLVLAAQVASAEPHHVLVLRAEGTIDDTLRARIDTQVLKLAKNIPGTVEAADITFSDATAVVGCNWTDTSCKDQVLTTMGVDELVATSVMSLPSGDLRVTVRRLPRGGAPQSASTTIPAGQPSDAKMNADIGPVFGLAADKTAKAAVTAPPIPPKGPTTTPPTPPTPPPPSAITTTTTPVPDTSTEPIVTPPQTPEPTVTAAPNNQVTAAPEGNNTRRRREIYGMAGGGGLVVLGFLLWGAADGVQSDISKAPTKTAADFKNLRDLESKADGEAGLGNLFFLGGVALAGVSAYFFWQDHRAGSSQQARIAPAVFDHGAGLTLSFGGGI